MPPHRSPSHRLGLGLAIVAGLFALAVPLGCSPTEYEPPSAMLYLGLEPLNVNHEGDSTPVPVRILALSSRNAFDREVRDFDLLWRDPGGLLEEELLASPIETTVFPSGEQAAPRRLAFPRRLPEETRYVAILALYHTEAFEHDRRRYLVVPAEEIEKSVAVFTDARVVVVRLTEQRALVEQDEVIEEDEANVQEQDDPIEQ